MLLAGCFAETLRGWAKLPDFSLNLTIFNRRGAHPQLAKLVADLRPCSYWHVRLKKTKVTGSFPQAESAVYG